MLIRNKIPMNKYVDETKHLYGIGSIITSGYQDAVVWGNGCLRESTYKRFWWRYFRKLDVICVRGPISRDILIANGYKCPNFYGDSAILMPLIYSPKIQKKYPYTVVHHFLFDNKNESFSISPMVKDYKPFIDRIANSKLIISSSLHGIILVETYGISAIS